MLRRDGPAGGAGRLWHQRADPSDAGAISHHVGDGDTNILTNGSRNCQPYSERANDDHLHLRHNSEWLTEDLHG
jgi:hypothetical protein